MAEIGLEVTASDGDKYALTNDVYVPNYKLIYRSYSLSSDLVIQRDKRNNIYSLGIAGYVLTIERR